MPNRYCISLQVVVRIGSGGDGFIVEWYFHRVTKA